MDYAVMLSFHQMLNRYPELLLNEIIKERAENKSDGRSLDRAYQKLK